MIGKRRYKELSALQLKKFRLDSRLFLAEGEKIIDELMESSFQIKTIFATREWLATHKIAARKCNELIEADIDELKHASLLKTPNKAIAVVYMPETDFSVNEIKDQLTLVLDEIQDPGNLGTIIRLCDWFGIRQIVCSNSTVEAFNPKVVQASMGSVFRVKVIYTELSDWIGMYNQSNPGPVYGAFLEGQNLYNLPLSKNGLIILGNESKGISTEVEKHVTQRITIPSYPASRAESLNVSAATAIICSEFRRRK